MFEWMIQTTQAGLTENEFIVFMQLETVRS